MSEFRESECSYQEKKSQDEFLAALKKPKERKLYFLILHKMCLSGLAVFLEYVLKF